jgi:hypothetical protein
MPLTKGNCVEPKETITEPKSPELGLRKDIRLYIGDKKFRKIYFVRIYHYFGGGVKS